MPMAVKLMLMHVPLQLLLSTVMQSHKTGRVQTYDRVVTGSLRIRSTLVLAPGTERKSALCPPPPPPTMVSVSCKMCVHVFVVPLIWRSVLAPLKLHPSYPRPPMPMGRGNHYFLFLLALSCHLG